MNHETERERGAMPQEESVNIKTPLGTVSAKGSQAVAVVLVATIVAGVAWAGYKHHEINEQKLDALAERMSEVVYVISLPQDKREALNLSMPSSLRKQTRRDREPRD